MELMMYHLLGSRVKRKWVYVLTLRRPSSDRPTVRTSDRPDVRTSVRNLNMDDCSETMRSWDVKLGHGVACHKAFQSMQVMMTLAQGQGHWVTLKCPKIELLPIFRTLLSVGQWLLAIKVAGGMAFKMIPNLMTLAQGQGHGFTLKWQKIKLLPIFWTLLTVG